MTAGCTQAAFLAVNLPAHFDDMDVVEDLAYGSDSLQKLDFYIPARTKEQPLDVIVFLWRAVDWRIETGFLIRGQDFHGKEFYRCRSGPSEVFTSALSSVCGGWSTSAGMGLSICDAPMCAGSIDLEPPSWPRDIHWHLLGMKPRILLGPGRHTGVIVRKRLQQLP